MLPTAKLLLVASLCTACGTTIYLDDDGEGGGNTNNTGGSGGSGGVGGQGAFGGEGGSGAEGGFGGSGGAGGGCGRTAEYLYIEVASEAGSSLGCATAEPGSFESWQLQGEIVAVEGETFTIDSCPPNADCLPILSRVTVSGAGFYMPLWTGVFVELEMMVDFPWGCSSLIEVRNLPVWGGVENPYGADDSVWFAASDGTPATLETSDIQINPLPLGCYPGQEDECGVPEDYVLQFQSRTDGSAVDVPMGQIGQFAADGQWLSAKNLRSYETGYCDDYWNWAYWVTRAGIK